MLTLSQRREKEMILVCLIRFNCVLCMCICICECIYVGACVHVYIFLFLFPFLYCLTLYKLYSGPGCTEVQNQNQVYFQVHLHQRGISLSIFVEGRNCKEIKQCASIPNKTIILIPRNIKDYQQGMYKNSQWARKNKELVQSTQFKVWCPVSLCWLGHNN